MGIPYTSCQENTWRASGWHRYRPRKIEFRFGELARSTLLCVTVIVRALETPVAYFFSSEFENRRDPAVAIRS
jgi:hypothetical protein